MSFKLYLKPSQRIALGVLINIIIGVIFISLPFCQKTKVSLIDNIFSIVSAISTTGLTTVSVSDNYTFWGQLIILIMFQIGGWGFMTISSFFILLIGRIGPLSIGISIFGTDKEIDRIKRKEDIAV